MTAPSPRTNSAAINTRRSRFQEGRAIPRLRTRSLIRTSEESAFRTFVAVGPDAPPSKKVSKGLLRDRVLPSLGRRPCQFDSRKSNRFTVGRHEHRPRKFAPAPALGPPRRLVARADGYSAPAGSKMTIFAWVSESVRVGTGTCPRNPRVVSAVGFLDPAPGPGHPPPAVLRTSDGSAISRCDPFCQRPD